MSECEEIRPRLAAFLNEEVENPEEIQAHVDTCPECAKLLEVHMKVTRLTSGVPGPPSHGEAWARVESRLSAFHGKRRYALIPAAAVAIIVVSFLVFPAGEGRIGLLSIMPLSAEDGFEPQRNIDLHEGDRIRTDPNAAATLAVNAG